VIVKIDSDEWYPVYSLCSPGLPYGASYDISDELHTRIEAAFREFDAVQDILIALVDGE